ncbi:MAG TPA: gephyrin-like molybdotransferase Glp [Solirubrobacteraceae bacterium]|nr:gephyrin-like molybdotransferase Glp [Solirubrobacteraceae bacterium]
MARELITIAAARDAVMASTPRLESERVDVLEAPGRVLAEEVRAGGDAPPFSCSAMDGYAIEPGPAGRELEVIGEARAGAPAPVALAPGRAIRISTGAAIPASAGAVIRQEDVERRDGRIVTRVQTHAGENVRHAGEDMRKGTLVLAAGTRLGAAEIGAAVAAGAGELVVSRRPRVHVLCTGDELREPGAQLRPGEIHNSNGPMLVTLARAAGALAEQSARLPDDRQATVAALAGALDAADLVLVAGGVSVGPHDHVKPALAELAVEERFWGVALQPGKPTWFGVRGNRLVFGLPGNPVSAFVTFVLFVRPALAALHGERAPARTGRARLGATVARSRSREQAVRVRLEAAAGMPVAVPNGPQGSHIVTSLVGADGLALIPPGGGELGPGDEVEIVPLRG